MQSIMEDLFQFEQSLEKMRLVTTEMQNQISQLMHENQELKLEIERLTHLSQPETTLTKNKQKLPATSIQMMHDLYSQGFHICNEEYGKRMKSGEHCLFCEGMLSRLAEGAADDARK
ncbi:initiation control protein YabA [Atopobacter phocae]|uniref:initiation control protein YabA n=1 Tax=Atopobacter phocae TaxID=136492 RepID=UPI00046F75E4|nr:initiation control protein YabA [Atopobacter phocae]